MITKKEATLWYNNFIVREEKATKHDIFVSVGEDLHLIVKSEAEKAVQEFYKFAKTPIVGERHLGNALIELCDKAKTAIKLQAEEIERLKGERE